MKKEILRKYYPGGVSAENYMFCEGKRLTATAIPVMIGLIIGGIVLSAVGTILPFIDSEALFVISGIVIDVVGVVLIAIGFRGLLGYRRGWLYLAQAEQLYYLRLIANEPEEPEEDGKKKEQRSSTATVTASKWKCTCGKEYPAYVSSCSCGVNRRDIL